MVLADVRARVMRLVWLGGERGWVLESQAAGMGD